MGAVMIAGLVSLGVAGDYIYFGVMKETLPLRAVLLACPAAGIVGGAAGGLFSRLVLEFAAGGTAVAARADGAAGGVRRAVRAGRRAAGAGSGGLTWGTGYNATKALVEGHGQPLWFGVAKFGAALATTLSGAPGGVFAPSLAVGAGVGNLLTPLFPDDPAGAIVLLGVTGYFVGVVRAPLTAVIIITETTASRGMILPLFFTALIAEVASTLVCRERLYHGLAKGFGVPAPAGAAEPVPH